MNFTNVVFLGCGNMGEPVLKAFLQSGVDPKRVTVIEKMVERREFLRKKYAVTVQGDFARLPCDVLILAIKPQQITEIDFSSLRFLPNAVTISILAGTPIERLKKVTGQSKIVRCMPNLPLMVGQGITSLVFENIAINEKEFFKKVFFQAGKVIELKSEDDMHAATLLAGSGPGFYYAFAAAFEAIAHQYGFSSEDSRILAEQTLSGSAEYLKTSKKSAEELVSMVASKGGTTEAALKSFEENHLREVLEKGIAKGIERSRELAI